MRKNQENTFRENGWFSEKCRRPVAISMLALLGMTLAAETNAAYATTPEPTPPTRITDISSLPGIRTMPEEAHATIIQQQSSDTEAISNAINNNGDDPSELMDISEIAQELDEEQQKELSKSLEDAGRDIVTQPDGTFGNLSDAIQERALYYQVEKGYKMASDTSVFGFYSNIIDAAGEDRDYVKTEIARTRLINIGALLLAPPTNLDDVKDLIVPRQVGDKNLQKSIDYYIETMHKSYVDEMFVDADTVYTKAQQTFLAKAMAASDLDVLTEDQLRSIVSIGDGAPEAPEKSALSKRGRYLAALTNIQKSGSDYNKRAASIASFFSKQDPRLKPYHLAALIGNCKQESECSWGAQQKLDTGKIGGIGFLQWDDDKEGEGRKTEYLKFAAERGAPWNDLGTQQTWAWKEMTGAEKEAYNEFVNAGNLKDATLVFAEKYERADTPHNPKRLAAAQEFLATMNTTIEAMNKPADEQNGDNTDARNKIVQIAKSQLGTTESPINCDRGNSSRKGDCGPINKYTQSRLEYWCADFASWVHAQAGVPLTGSAKNWNIPAVRTIKAKGKALGISHSKSGGYKPQPGDFIAFTYSHVAIVIGYDPSTDRVTYIGGNQKKTSGSRNGTTVSQQSVSRTAKSVSLYVEPRLK